MGCLEFFGLFVLPTHRFLVIARNVPVLLAVIIVFLMVGLDQLWVKPDPQGWFDLEFERPEKEQSEI